ncbi:dnaJ homolog subfamily C member 1 [Polymixia lowei]
MTFVSQGPSLFFTAGIVLVFVVRVAAWDSDLELFDLVEETPQSFYDFLSVQQDASPAEIKKAYRRLSLTLHPDKNKDENAETQFRQLVAIYEVLKDEERRQRYNDILVNGLPDWRQPVFYYRRVRKMSNAELGFLLFLILTVGHYAVIWSIYLEKQLDEMLSKKKKKKKVNSRPVEELRVLDRPHWQDILPLKLSIWLYLSIKALPQTIQEVKKYYEDYKEMKMREREEAEEEAEQETIPREKRSKVKKSKVEFPVYEASVPEGLYQSYDQSTSIEDIEDQMDDWLEDRKSKKKTPAWTEEDLSLLSRSMVKFPGGTPGRWEKVAHELGRSVTDVTTKVKQVKECVSNISGLVRLSDLKGAPPPWKASPRSAASDSLISQRDSSAPPGGMEEEGEVEVEGGGALRRRTNKATGDGGEIRVKGRRQRDFDPLAMEEEVEETQKERCSPADSIWTQNQQKLLELALQQFPRGTTERWDRIAKVVPGKSKEECMIRYKLLAELVQKRKQAKS